MSPSRSSDLVPPISRARGRSAVSRCAGPNSSASPSQPSASFGAETRAVHIFHQMWVHDGVDPDGPFSAAGLYASWKRSVN